MHRPADGSRRDLLRSTIGDWLARMIDRTERRVLGRRHLRPPGALPEVEFLAACTRCGACAEACPPQVIRLVGGDGGLGAGTPYLDPAVQPCVACLEMPCAAACPTPALTRPAEAWRGYRLAVVELVPERCVTFEGIACGACAAACPMGEAALGLDDLGRPVLRREGCVGCGVCVRACITTPSSFDLTYAEG